MHLRAGAIGGYMGVLLRLGGAEVSLIACGAHLEAIRRDGLKLLIGDDEKVARMTATSDPAELGPQDFSILPPFRALNHRSAAVN
jgi:2-dehydropantoate 2-reductase